MSKIEAKLQNLMKLATETVEHYIRWASEKYTTASNEFPDAVRDAVTEEVLEELRNVSAGHSCPHGSCVERRLERRLETVLPGMLSAAPFDLLQELRRMLGDGDWIITSVRDDNELQIVVRPAGPLYANYGLLDFVDLFDKTTMAASSREAIRIEGDWQTQFVLLELYYAPIHPEPTPARAGSAVMN